jgi:signal transduction histidine kinase
MSAMLGLIRSRRPPPDREARRLDSGVILLTGLLTISSIAIWFEPELSGRIFAPFVDVAIDAAATLVSGAVAILAWVRWRETLGAAALYESSAFVVLTITSGLKLGLVLAGRGDVFGLDPAAPGPQAAYLWALARLAAAGLLVAGAVRGLLSDRETRHPLAIAIGPAVGILLIAFALAARPGELLPLVSAAELPQETSLASAAIVLAQVIVFGAYLLAAVLFRRLYLRDRLVSHAFLTAGLVVAAFSQLHFVLDPDVAAGFVTSGDVLRLGFNAILFLGVQAELQADLAALRRANSELLRLRDVDAASAALAERSRLAREIHDGLAQELWYAKLKQGRLVQAPELEEPTRMTGREVLSALDTALADARQAVMALRVDLAASGSSLGEVLRTYIDDFADRYGVRAEMTVDGDVPRLSPRTEAEMLRIVQEALNNVRRHADATIVRVRLECVDNRVRVTIGDNGRGFDTGSVGPERYGLRGMRERAELVGGNLMIDSRPTDGTRVSVDVPFGEATA